MIQAQKGTIITLVVAGVISFGGSALSMGESGPDEVIIDQLENLYEPVIFDHAHHQEMYTCARCHHGGDETQEGCMTCHGNRPLPAEDTCSSCHVRGMGDKPVKDAATSEPTYHIDTPGLVGAYHLLCRNCHLEEGGPTDCRQCHGLSATGRNFFHANRTQ